MQVIQGPTLANPDAFSTVEELRKHLHRANDLLMSQFLTTAQLNDGVTMMAQALNRMLIAHMTGNAETLVQLLDDYLSTRPALREELEAAIQSRGAQRPH